MSFLETPRFPDDIAFWAKGGPGYNTTVIVVQSGNEQRNANWNTGRAQYNIGNGMRTYAQVAAVIAYFRSVKGKAYGFRFKDFQDFNDSINSVGAGVINTNGLGNGTSTGQLYKNYVNGALTDQRIIQKPVAATIKIYKNGVLQTLTTNYTLDSTTGIVTWVGGNPSSAVALTWTGEFDVPVRFDSDTMVGGPDGGPTAGGGEHYSWDNVNLVEIRDIS